MTLVAVRRAFGIAGIALLGGALAIAPVVAFGGDMRIVSGIGIAGIACLIVMRLLPRPPSAGAMDGADGGDDPPGRRNDA
ncbi:MAG TPA: hypothetical protein VFQ55_01625 [Casimicrobiaceae bacterium]|nr:hypothetical protein [Casimicrobiaceae bacterium]